MFRRGLLVAAAMLSAWLPYYGGDWLVHHDAIYYKLADSGYRWLTDPAEMANFIGPIPLLVIGFVLGVILALTLPARRIRGESELGTTDTVLRVL